MQSLKIFNTLSRSKQAFIPLVPGQVKMYVCGMTVYDYCHIGHARVMVVFDMVQRWLRSLGYQVVYVRNITDVDDKIIQRAQENGEAIADLTARFIQAMHEDAQALGVQRPDYEPRATEYIPEMQQMITRLLQNGLAYQANDGDVNYAVRKFPGYGKLSGKSLDDLRAGERVAAKDSKQDPLDFVLWKTAKPSESNESRWSSPWGEGRPGWHIECSAMSCSLLGEHFDIHGGGADLQFPHHENEIAQAEGASGQPFVNVWMHNGFVRVNDEKMSKSLGNFFTIREVLKQYDAEVIRFFILRAHYRSPLNYGQQQLDETHYALTRLYTALKEVPENNDLEFSWDMPYAQRFRDALNDDFNTPEAIAVLFELATEIHRHSFSEVQYYGCQLRYLAGLLGLLQRPAHVFLQRSKHANSGKELSEAIILEKIAARLAAKQAKDYALADKIRSELFDFGIVLEDKPSGVTEWRRN